MVYGSDSVRAKWMRTFSKGKLKTSAGNFLPWNTLNGEYTGTIDPNAPDMANDSGHTIKTFAAGDVRAAEHPGITGMHTLFVREHNRICDLLVAQGFKNDEIIYQLARKEVGDLIQAITYQEFLPAVGVVLDRYAGYKPNVRPDIMNTFATAAYRIGHTMVADDILLRNNQCQVVAPGALDLVDVFWTPNALPTYQMEPFLKGFASHALYETDTRINSVLRNFLFNNNNPADTTRFEIDLWIGILSEDHISNASLGLTMSKILKAQFELLRDGDYYFYLNDPYLPFSVRNEVSRTRFADVLQRNTKLTTLQSNVFFTLPCPGETGEDSVAAVDSLLSPTAEQELNTTARIFPNPATHNLHVDFGNWTDKVNLSIFNTGNSLVKTQVAAEGAGGLDIDISGLAPGIYIVSISNSKDVKTFKLVKTAN
ncbi:MAG TPA: peroxidase family protein [Puia sp.]